MKIKISYDKLYGVIFAAYVGMGPIYWIPWVNIKVIELIKTALFFAIIFWPILQGTLVSRFNFPGGKKVFLLFFTFFLISIPSMLQGEQTASFYRLQNTVQIFTFLFACGFLTRKKMAEYVVSLAVRIFVFFGILSLVLMLVVPDYVSPLNDGLNLSQTGLGGSRTGWSPSIALYIPWLYSGFLISSGYWLWIGGLSMIANQVLVAGRTGMVAALIPFLFYGLLRKNVKVFILVAVGIATISFLAIDNLELLRLGVGGLNGRAGLDELSTGRTEQYLVALNAISERPIMGYGTGELQFKGSSWLIHNIPLKFATEGGIPYALSVVGLFVIALYRGWKGFGKRDWFVVSAFLTVLSGVITSLFEPGAMYGSFNSAGFWWLCFAICVNTRQLPHQNSQMVS
jgi:O-antigen ligase